VNDIGVAVVGTGFMGWVHVEALRRVGAKVVGICGSSDEKSRHAARKLGIPNAYRSYQSALEDPAVNVVHIVTPNRLHFSMTKQALEAGKHVMCEKPLAISSSEAAELIALASQHPDQATAVNYNIRFYPLCVETRERIRRSDIGELFHVTGSYVQDWLLYPTDFNWRVLSAEGGPLRAVADIGTHWFDLIQFITGTTIESVCADLKTMHPQRFRSTHDGNTFSGKLSDSSSTIAIDIATDDYGAILLRFEGGARGTVHVSQVTAGRKNCLRFEIAGSQQSIAWNSEVPNTLLIGHRNAPNESLIRDPSLLTNAATAVTSYPGGHNEGFDDSFKQCFKAFYDYIREGDFSAEPPVATFADGYRELALCESIFVSNQDRAWVDVPKIKLAG
jgi:predicted dehydrogenase